VAGFNSNNGYKAFYKNLIMVEMDENNLKRA